MGFGWSISLLRDDQHLSHDWHATRNRSLGLFAFAPGGSDSEYSSFMEIATPSSLCDQMGHCFRILVAQFNRTRHCLSPEFQPCFNIFWIITWTMVVRT